MNTDTMEKTSITGIDMADYYGNVVENIEFDNKIEIDLEEITIRVSNFSFSHIEDEETAVIQCDLQESFGDLSEVEEAHSQIMEILLENTDGELENENEVSDRLLKAIELLILSR